MKVYLKHGLLLAGASMVVVPAHAGIILDTLASVDQSGFSRQTGYNSFQVYDSGPGFHLHDSTQPCTGGCLGYNLSNTGLTDTTGNATSGFLSTDASVQLQYGGPIYNAPYFDVSSSAHAYAGASLNDGTVKVAAQGTFLDSYPNPNSGQNGGSGAAFAQFGDELHFAVAGAAANTTTLIGISYTLDGLMTGASGSGDVANQLNFGTGYLRDEYESGGSVPAHVYSTAANGWVSYSFSSNTAGLLVFNAVYALTGPETDLGIAATVTAQCSLGTNCDYSHTAQFGISDMPAGVSFTSDSGVFLTSQTATPEPGGAVLFLSALTAFWIWRRGQPEYLTRIKRVASSFWPFGAR